MSGLALPRRAKGRRARHAPRTCREKMTPDLRVERFRSLIVLRLKRGIYGLKQAGRIWYQSMIKGLIELGFPQSISDPCLFHMISEDRSDVIYITTWVDDCIVSYNNPETWKRVLEDTKDWEQRVFLLKKKKDMDDIFLSVEISKISKNPKINNISNPNKINACFGVFENSLYIAFAVHQKTHGIIKIK